LGLIRPFIKYYQRQNHCQIKSLSTDVIKLTTAAGNLFPHVLPASVSLAFAVKSSVILPRCAKKSSHFNETENNT
jgi:hypothetical protein